MSKNMIEELKKMRDINIRNGCFEDSCKKAYNFAIERAKHYAEKTGLDINVLLEKWEKDRNVTFPNWYQDCKFPCLDGKVRVFENLEELNKSIKNFEFICPCCKQISTNAYECNSGYVLKNNKICNWKVYGLLSDLGKGIFIFVKSEKRGQKIFLPKEWRDYYENNC
jgi:hypothetical protein